MSERVLRVCSRVCMHARTNACTHTLAAVLIFPTLDDDVISPTASYYHLSASGRAPLFGPSFPPFLGDFFQKFGRHKPQLKESIKYRPVTPHSSSKAFSASTKMKTESMFLFVQCGEVTQETHALFWELRQL